MNFSDLVLALLDEDAALSQKLARPRLTVLGEIGRLRPVTARDETLIGESVEDLEIVSFPAPSELTGRSEERRVGKECRL